MMSEHGAHNTACNSADLKGRPFERDNAMTLLYRDNAVYL